MRTLETLIQQALMMQELDHAANGNELVKGWYADLLPEEKQLFDEWIIDITNKIEQTFGGFAESLAEIGQHIMESLSKGLTPQE